MEFRIFRILQCTALVVGFVGWSGTEHARAQDPAYTRLLAQPAISARQIAFCHDGDLWVANRDGTNPYRLTSHKGTESHPRFSPDGQSIAFSGEYDGNTDVYVVPIVGGAPKRLTFHPDADEVESFTRDGQAVLFSSPRNSYTNRYRQLFTVSLEGGFPNQLPIPNGLRATYSLDGAKIAYVPIAERFQQWKNYRGGTCSRIWIYDTADHSVRMVPQPEGRCNDTNPAFVGDRLYFRSDRQGEFNLFSFDPATTEMKQWTNFGDFPIQDLSACDETIIFEQAGYLHLFDCVTNGSRQLNISIATDAIESRERFASGTQWIRNADISPSGSRAVLEFRGEIVTVPASKGDPRNLTRTPGVHERSPAWSPDGQSIAYFSDAGGAYHLVISPQKGGADVNRIVLAGNGFFEDPQWSPDGKRISYCDNSWSLYVVDIESRRCERICGEPKFGPTRSRGLQHSWSADSAWIAYTVNTEALIQQAFVYDVAKNKSFPITDGMSEVSEPCFDASGKFLYFLASTDAGPLKHWFAMSNNDMRMTNQIYVAVLQDDGPNPLARESDEEPVLPSEPNRTPSANSNNPADPGNPDGPPGGTGAVGPGKEQPTQGDGEKRAATDPPKGTTAVRIDFEGIEQRILALPIAPALHSGLRPGAEGTLWFVKQDANSERSLVSYSLKDHKSTTVIESAVDRFDVTPDGKKVLYGSGTTWGIADAGNKISPGTGKLAVEAIRVRVDPRQEWPQIFDEVWRINRDFFYDPGMHGANWPAMREKYQQFVPHCATRDDLNRVLMWMCSELAVGHHRVGGGDDITTAPPVPGGLLGADFSLDAGRYRVKKVYGGLNWNGDLRAPLTEPGVRVKEGEYILAIDGSELHSTDSIFRHLVHKAGKIVELKVGPEPDGSKSRLVSVVPVSSEGALRNRDWIEGNRKRVHAATDGRVAYVYVPNTATAGHEYFKRYFFPQTDKQAIIIDERFNGGGQVADYYIDHLSRRYVSHWATRYGNDFITPTGAIFGPKVMIIDETAGSGGDLLPFMFRQLGIGTLVGRRTWGGLVGILGFPTLMDGGTVTAPNLAIWTEDGFVVENVGVPPDVEVEQMPAEVIAGHDPQLEKAIEVILRQLAENPPKQYTRPPYPIRVRP